MTEQKMKKCKNCGAEIPKDAIYCDICGELASTRLERRSRRQKSANRARKSGYARTIKSFLTTLAKVLGIIFALMIVIAFIGVRIEDHKYREYERKRDLSGWEVTVTPEIYEKIDLGMTYEEVKEIIGGDGKMIEDDKYGTDYYWPGEYYVPRFHGYLNLYFSKNNYGEYKGAAPTLSTIRESEIIDGAETIDTYNAIDNFDYSKIDTPIITKEQVMKLTEGMTYDKACEVLGGEGKMYLSTSWKHASYENVEKSYVWRCKHNERDYYFELQFDDGIIKYLWDWRVDNVD